MLNLNEKHAGIHSTFIFYRFQIWKIKSWKYVSDILLGYCYTANIPKISVADYKKRPFIYTRGFICWLGSSASSRRSALHLSARVHYSGTAATPHTTILQEMAESRRVRETQCLFRLGSVQSFLLIFHQLEQDTWSSQHQQVWKAYYGHSEHSKGGKEKEKLLSSNTIYHMGNLLNSS